MRKNLLTKLSVEDNSISTAKPVDVVELDSEISTLNATTNDVTTGYDDIDEAQELQSVLEDKDADLAAAQQEGATEMDQAVAIAAANEALSLVKARLGIQDSGYTVSYESYREGGSSLATAVQLSREGIKEIFAWIVEKFNQMLMWIRRGIMYILQIIPRIITKIASLFSSKKQEYAELAKEIDSIKNMDIRQTARTALMLWFWGVKKILILNIEPLVLVRSYIELKDFPANLEPTIENLTMYAMDMAKRASSSSASGKYSSESLSTESVTLNENNLKILTSALEELKNKDRKFHRFKRNDLAVLNAIAVSLPYDSVGYLFEAINGSNDSLDKILIEQSDNLYRKTNPKIVLEAIYKAVKSLVDKYGKDETAKIPYQEIEGIVKNIVAAGKNSGTRYCVDLNDNVHNLGDGFGVVDVSINFGLTDDEDDVLVQGTLHAYQVEGREEGLIGHYVDSTNYKNYESKMLGATRYKDTQDILIGSRTEKIGTNILTYDDIAQQAKEDMNAPVKRLEAFIQLTQDIEANSRSILKDVTDINKKLQDEINKAMKTVTNNTVTKSLQALSVAALKYTHAVTLKHLEGSKAFANYSATKTKAYARVVDLNNYRSA